MTIKLNVKNESAWHFLEKNIIGFKEDRNHNPYYLMKDEMFFKNDCGIDIGESIQIEIFDKTEISKKELVNQYIYTAEQYDDISIKMVLTGFEIKNKN